METQVFTIGHGANSIGSFMDTLNQHKIDVLVDIRERPVSRYFSHFNKKSLEKIETIEYIFAGAQLHGSADFHNELLEVIASCGQVQNTLNSLIEEEKEYIFSKHTEVSNNDKRKKYITRKYLHHFVSDNLHEVATTYLEDFFEKNIGKRICFMCSEKDYETCHRHHLLEKKWLKDIQVTHLLCDKMDSDKNQQLF